MKKKKKEKKGGGGKTEQSFVFVPAEGKNRVTDFRHIFLTGPRVRQRKHTASGTGDTRGRPFLLEIHHSPPAFMIRFESRAPDGHLFPIFETCTARRHHEFHRAWKTSKTEPTSLSLSPIRVWIDAPVPD